MLVGKRKGENKDLKRICMDNYFQNIFPKISGSQEDKQISIFGCPHSIFGSRGHEDTRILLPCIKYRDFFKGMAKCEKWKKKWKKKICNTLELVFDITTEKVELELI